MNKDELIKLHDLVKVNLFRANNIVNIKYAKGYFTLLTQLSNEFYKHKNELESLRVGMDEFFHDFNCAIGVARNYSRLYEQTSDTKMLSKMDNAMVHIERCLGIIHRYIDFNNFDSYYGDTIIENAVWYCYKSWDFDSKTFKVEFTIYKKETYISLIMSSWGSMV